jgi:septum formation protein
MPELILASTSSYRRELLRRLGLHFGVEKPLVDEAALAGEAPRALAKRLAREKALAVARRFPGAVVIGSDQVAEHDARALGKPGTRERACEQLSGFSGQTVHFHTALCVLQCMSEGDAPIAHTHVSLTRVRFRRLLRAEIERYVDREQVLDCAGSFKSEGLGIALFDAIDSDDPSALIGLPLIKLADILRNFGFAIP